MWSHTDTKEGQVLALQGRSRLESSDFNLYPFVIDGICECNSVPHILCVLLEDYEAERWL